MVTKLLGWPENHSYIYDVKSARDKKICDNLSE